MAHLGIVTGRCLSESATLHLPKRLSQSILATAMLASVSTSLAEILGGAVALRMLFHIPLQLGAILMVMLALFVLFTNSYRRLDLNF